MFSSLPSIQSLRAFKGNSVSRTTYFQSFKIACLSSLLVLWPEPRYTGTMTNSHSEEITVEEIGESPVDLGPYELVRWEVQGNVVVVVVRDKARTPGEGR